MGNSSPEDAEPSLEAPASHVSNSPASTLHGLPLIASSIGGLETSIDLPEWRCAVDLGRSPARLLPRATILITHAHLDHLGGVAHHCATRSLLGMAPPTYVIPADIEAPLERLFAAWRELDSSELPHRLIPARPGDRIPLRPDLFAMPFRTIHPVVSQGYTFFSVKKRLREAYRGLPQKELQRLATSEGVDLSERTEIPELAVTGDSRIEVLDQQPELYQVPRLVLECTFLDDRVDVQRARTTGHVHLDEILERADRFENQAIGLVHFSARYSRREILRILSDRLPASLRERMTPLFPPRGEDSPAAVADGLAGESSEFG